MTLALERIERAVRESLADRFVDARGVAEALGYSYTYARDSIVSRPDFPAPLRIDGGHARWLRSEVIAWGKARKAA